MPSGTRASGSRTASGTSSASGSKPASGSRTASGRSAASGSRTASGRSAATEEREPTTLDKLPPDVLERILKKTSLSTAAKAKTVAKFMEKAIPLEYHPEAVEFVKEFTSVVYGALIYASVSQKLIYQKRNADDTYCTYDLSTGEVKEYVHQTDEAHTYYIQLYASKDGSVIFTKKAIKSNRNEPFSIKVWEWNSSAKEYKQSETYTNPISFTQTAIKYMQPTSYRISATSAVQQEEGTPHFAKLQMLSDGIQPVIVHSSGMEIFKGFHAMYYLQPWRQLILIKGNTMYGFSVDAKYNILFDPTPWGKTLTVLERTDLLMIHTIEISKQGTQFAILFAKHSLVVGSSTRAVKHYIAIWDWPRNTQSPTLRYEIPSMGTPNYTIMGRTCAFSPNGAYLVFLSQKSQTNKDEHRVHLWDIEAKDEPRVPIKLIYKNKESVNGKTDINGTSQLGFYKKHTKDHIAVITATGKLYSFAPEVPLVGGRRRRAPRAVLAPRK